MTDKRRTPTALTFEQRQANRAKRRQAQAAKPPAKPGAKKSTPVSGPEQIRITQIRADGGTQMRAGLNSETVAEYAEAIHAQNRLLDWPFPPLTVYHDGTDYWLADGFHRLAAFRQALRIDDSASMVNPDLAHTLPAIVHSGDRRDAILYAAGANAAHGLRRTNADKRRAVETLLRDEEWQQLSNRKIADTCAVSLDLVNRIRDELSERFVQMPIERKVTRQGTTYTVDTSNIGKRAIPTTPALEEEELAAMQEVALAQEVEEAERLAIGDGEIKTYRVVELRLEQDVAQELEAAILVGALRYHVSNRAVEQLKQTLKEALT